MWWAEFLWALVLALFVGGIFYAISRPPRTDRPESEEEAAQAGAWGLLWFFLALILGTWAIGAWIEPVGPIFWGVAWLPFLWAALLVLLLIAAASSADWGTRWGPRGSGRRHPGRRSVPTPTNTRTSGPAEEAVVAVGIFFWIFLLVALVAIVAAYIPFAD